MPPLTKALSWLLGSHEGQKSRGPGQLGTPLCPCRRAGKDVPRILGHIHRHGKEPRRAAGARPPSSPQRPRLPRAGRKGTAADQRHPAKTTGRIWRRILPGSRRTSCWVRTPPLLLKAGRHSPKMCSVDLTTRECDGQVVVVLRGELDVADAIRVMAELPIVAARERDIIIELAGLEFIDSSGLATLVRVRKHARQRGPTPRASRTISRRRPRRRLPAARSPQ